MNRDKTPNGTVIENVVNRDLCVGCGVCAGICATKSLQMVFNRYGEYVPIYSEAGCKRLCGLCLEVCPFFNSEYYEDSLGETEYSQENGISHRPEIGYYLSSYAGHVIDEERRWNSASGGLATWFLAELLSKNIVDRIVCVVPEDKIGRLFKFTIINDPESVGSSSKSSYYPVELSSVVEKIMESEMDYCVIALPCFIKSLRLAMGSIPKLERNIKMLAGLTCGHTVGKYFAEYLCASNGGDPYRLSKARFRTKDIERRANDYGFYYESAGGEAESGTIHFSEEFGNAWMKGYFKLNACNYCDDVFAELADIVFMDAWLERYVHDPKGNSLVVVRKKEIDEIIHAGIEQGRVSLEPVPLDDVLESQRGVLFEKREKLAKHLALRRGKKGPLIIKRVEPISATTLERLQLLLEARISARSKKIFLRQRSRQNPVYLKRRMRLMEFMLRILKYLSFEINKKWE